MMRLVALALVLAAAGCTGLVEGRAADEPSDSNRMAASRPGTGELGAGRSGAPGGAAGDPAGAQPGAAVCTVDEPVAEKLHRLTRYEYLNTLQSLFGAAILSAPEIVQELDALTKDMTETHPDPYTVQSDQALAFFEIASNLGALLVSNTALRASALPACAATSAASPACVDETLKSFGERSYRRPLSQTEMAFHARVLADAPGGAGDKLQAFYASLLTVPAFLYHVENDGEPVPGRSDLYKITPWALASRLSYGLWGTMPDRTLFDLARSGKLAEEATLREQVHRLIDDPKGKQHIVALLGNWLDVEKSVEFVFPDQFLGGLNLTGVRSAMKAELDEYLKYVVWDARGTYRDLLTSTVSIVKNATLAKIYNATPDASGRVKLDAAERKGVLGKGAVLNKVGRLDTSVPIKRGVFVYRQFLCQVTKRPDQVTLPPGSLDPIPLSPEMSIRDSVDAKTSQGVCASCHAAFNPFGFLLETYDPLGRFRTTESVFDMNGKLVRKLPVNARATVSVADQPVTLDGAGQLADFLAGSEASARCFAQRALEQIVQRALGAGDGCAHRRMLGGLTGDGGSIRDMFVAAFTDKTIGLEKLGK